jgi:hypothetical protein
MEKYGFVYLWYDRKRKMYYVGCHWGTEDDGYICSSNRMRDAYRRRPEDFKRRIIEKTNDKLNLYEVEYKWLSMIDDDDLGKRYYNLRNHKWNHWSSDENSSLSVKEKVSQTKRKYWDSPESDNMKQQVSDFHKKRGTKPPSQKGKVPWNKGLTKDTDPRVATNALALLRTNKPKRKRAKPISEETRRLVSDNMKAIWAERNKMKHKEII